MRTVMTVSAVAHLRGLSPSLLKWRQLVSEGGRTAVKAAEDVVGSSRVREFEARIRYGTGKTRADSCRSRHPAARRSDQDALPS
jgi:hypothetical protein